MLETTLNNQYIPGSNLKGEVSGAAWTYLLPSLEQEQTVCIGRPGIRTLKTLSRISQQLIVLCISPEELRLTRKACEPDTLSNVQVLRIAVPEVLPLISGGTNLIYLATRKATRKFQRDAALNRELQRVLKPNGVIYYESQTAPYSHSKRNHQKQDNVCTTQSVRLSPMRGEVQTAIPIDAQEVSRFFTRNQLEHPLLNLSLIKRVGRVILRPHRSNRQSRPERTRPIRTHGLRKPKLPAALRNAGHRMLQGIQQTERRLKSHSILNRCFERYGILTHSNTSLIPRQSAFSDWLSGDEWIPKRGQGKSCTTDDTPRPIQPPQYLCDIAQQDGIDISTFRFGMSADGEFQSRKTLFFLFPENESTPRYVVKLSRDSSYNHRVEQEQKALELLAELPPRISMSVPKMAFFGYHNQLAILSQSAIAEQPFVSRTKAKTDCPYAQQAIDWIGDLGAATADHSSTSPDKTADALESLFDQFNSLYQLEPHRKEFLYQRINSLRNLPTGCPSVFLHGDPHTTNLMVTDSGKIAFVDWEASDPRGMPLWDLLFFLRAYSVLTTRTHNHSDQLKLFEKHFLNESAFGSLVLQSIEGYCKKMRLSSDLIEPLFYTCWIHRALREASRLPPSHLNQGVYFNLLKLCIDKRESPFLKRLFSAGIADKTVSTEIPVEETTVEI